MWPTPQPVEEGPRAASARASAHDAAVPVIYIGGCQRSGSTLLDRMVSQLPGHLSAGEVVHLWVRGAAGNELCGCGAAFLECPFWSEVGRVAFDGWERVSVERLMALQRRVDRNRFIPFMLFPRIWPRYGADLHSYALVLERLYRAMYRVGGGSAVVDSSKHASTAFLLRRVRGLRLSVVHLVRDSRGVAFSRLKLLHRPEARDRMALMQRVSPGRSALEWLVFNGLFHLLRVVGTPVLRVKYEDLVEAPRDMLRRISEHAGASLPEPSLSFLDGGSVMLGVDHTVAGNPMRFKHGSIELRTDEAWRRLMSRGQRLVTTVLTWPLLAMYRYRLGAP